MGPGSIPDKVEYKKLVHVDFVFGSCLGVMGSEGERERDIIRKGHKLR